MITGIINQTKTAKEDTEIASEKEVLEVSSINAMAKDRNGDVTKNNLDIELDKNIGNGKYESTEIEEGIVVTFTESDRSYLVDVDGKVESFDIVKDTTPWELAGSGTEEEPYLIESIEDLVEFSKEVNQSSNKFQNKYIKLAITLDFNSELSYCDSTTKVSEKTNRIIEKDDNGIEIKEFLTSGSGFAPIENSSRLKFVFDGNNKEIRNIYINRPEEDEVALFGKINGGEGQVIKNLGVTGNIIGNSSVAGIVGTESQAGAVIENCYNKANIKGNANFVAGIVGTNTGKILCCFNLGTIVGEQSIGGICGSQNNYEIENCYNGGTIGSSSVDKFFSYSGGIIGHNNGGRVANCYNIGEVTGKNFVGGIIGGQSISENVQNCYYQKGSAIGGVNGQDYPNQVEVLDNKMTNLINLIQNQIEIDNEMVNVWKEDTENINNGYPILYWQ